MGVGLRHKCLQEGHPQCDKNDEFDDGGGANVDHHRGGIFGSSITRWISMSG